MSLIKNITVVFVSLIVSIKCGDLLIGALKPESSFGIYNRGVERSINLREHNPNYQAMLTLTDSYMKNVDSLQRKQYLIKTDENGFIDTGNQTPKTNVISEKIVFLGGSTTELLFVSEKNRWQSILERFLNKEEAGQTYKVLNGGVSGNNVMHSTLNFIAKVIPLKPDCVVLMHNVNDLARLRQTGSYWKASKGYSLIEVASESNESSILFLFARKLRDLFIPNTYLLVLNLNSEGDDFTEYRDEPLFGIEVIEDQFRRALNSFVDIAIQWNVEPILMTQFNRINIKDKLFINSFQSKNINEFIEKYHRLNQVIREVGLSRKIDVVDLAELVPASGDYMYDSVHLNDNGSVLVAKILTDYWSTKLGLSQARSN